MSTHLHEAGVATLSARLLGDTAAHPLAPLTPEEIEATAGILRAAGRLAPSSRISYLGLEEPAKHLMAEFAATGVRPDRLARVLTLELTTGVGHDVLVSLGQSAVLDESLVSPDSHGHVPLLVEEHALVLGMLTNDERYVAALALRGVTDFSQLEVAALSAGYFDADSNSRRLARVLACLQPTPNSIPWAYPIDGLVAFVDMTTHEVVDVIDTGVIPIPTEHGDYHIPGAFGDQRTTLKPIVISQPEGVSFSVEGTRVRWQNWDFRIGYDMREGLVLHQLGFEDHGRTRPVINRASVAEMVVPYGDPSPVRYWQNYFDTGEYQLGNLANSLERGCDCVGEIQYFDVAVAAADGSARIVKNAICMHEEDAGILWKHSESATGQTESRRQRRLVISFFVTVGNYDYGFYWYLYLDGMIELEAKATGIVFASGYDERGSAYSSHLAPGLAAPYHQHLFNVRLDMAVDGDQNSVDEIDVTPIPMSPENPWGNAIGRTFTRLTTESEGARVADNNVDRVWRVSNSTATNRMGAPTGYILFPEGKSLLAAAPESVIAHRAAFATRHLWVTQYSPDERFPAGTIVNQSPLDQGLPQYVAQNRSIDGADIVLWHTFGLTHFPRAEDWPIMPVDSCGFVLKPDNFFDRNPTLDVPADTSGHSASGHSASGSCACSDSGCTCSP